MIFRPPTYRPNLLSICVIYTNIGTSSLSYDLSIPIFAQIYHDFYTINVHAKLMKHLCNVHQYWYNPFKLWFSYAKYFHKFAMNFYTINVQTKLMKHLCNLHQYLYKSVKLWLNYANICTNLLWFLYHQHTGQLILHLCNLHKYWHKPFKLRLSYANICTNLPLFLYHQHTGQTY